MGDNEKQSSEAKVVSVKEAAHLCGVTIPYSVQ